MRKRVHHPAGDDPWPAETIMYGPRAHWRITGARAVESRVWVNSWLYDVEPLGPHGQDFDQLHQQGAAVIVPVRSSDPCPDLRI